MRFGVSLPTGKEGLSAPLPFCSAPPLIDLARLAERLGYDSVWGNDHVHAPAYVRADYAEPPRFYELLVTLAAVAGATERVRLGTAVLVLPLREPVTLAHQAATLDQLSGGRLVLGVGLGSYREEFEAVRPRCAGVVRGDLMDEMLVGVRMLLTERRAAMTGEHVAFDVELHPKPAQARLPILVGGNHPSALRRAAMLGDGWIPTGVDAAAIRRGREQIAELAATAGRDPSRLAVAPQIMCCLARSREQAQARFRGSRYYAHLRSLAGSTLVGALDQAEAVNLVGTPADVVERVDALAAAGVGELGAISFLADTVEQMAEDIELFAETVMPRFAARAAG